MPEKETYKEGSEEGAAKVSSSMKGDVPSRKAATTSKSVAKARRFSGSVASGRSSFTTSSEESVSSLLQTLGIEDDSNSMMSEDDEDSTDGSSARVLFKAVAKQRAMDEAAFRRRSSDAMDEHLVRNQQQIINHAIPENEVLGADQEHEATSNKNSSHPSFLPSNVTASSATSSVTTKKKNLMTKPSSFQSITDFRSRFLIRRRNRERTTSGIMKEVDKSSSSTSRCRLGFYLLSGCFVIMCVSLILIAVFLGQMVQMQNINKLISGNYLRGASIVASNLTDTDTMNETNIFVGGNDEVVLSSIDNVTADIEDVLVLGFDNATIVVEDVLLSSNDNSTIVEEVIVSSVDIPSVVVDAMNLNGEFSSAFEDIVVSSVDIIPDVIIEDPDAASSNENGVPIIVNTVNDTTNTTGGTITVNGD